MIKHVEMLYGVLNIIRNMAVLLFSLYINHDDRPICLNTMGCGLSLPPPLHNCITVDMLFNIVGHKTDGNYESWKMGQKTERDRLAQCQRLSLKSCWTSGPTTSKSCRP